MWEINFFSFMKSHYSDESSGDDEYSEALSNKNDDQQQTVGFEKEEFITNIVSSLEQNQHIHSTIHLQQKPYLQCIKQAYSLNSKHQCAAIALPEWTQQMKEDAVQSLLELKVPLKKVSLKQIYDLLSNSRKDIFESSAKYPILFQGNVCYEETPISSTSPSQTTKTSTSFELEIHSNQKVSLIFRNLKATFIDNGSFKSWIKAYPLGKPKKLIAYSYSLPPENSLKAEGIAEQVMNREEDYWITFSGQPHIAKIYDIFYYMILHNGKLQKQQVMTMKYYPHDLFAIMETEDPHLVLTDQMKIHYCIQMAEAVQEIHAKKIIHRDIKLENFLVLFEKGEIKLTDLGLACHQDDPIACASRVGSPSTAAPELFNSSNKNTSLDIWALGCIFWIVLSGSHSFYPWYEEVIKEKCDFEFVDLNMLCYDKYPPTPKSKMTFLLWNMMRYKAENRWGIKKVLDYLHDLEKELPKQPAYSFPQQFCKEYQLQEDKIRDLVQAELEKCKKLEEEEFEKEKES